MTIVLCCTLAITNQTFAQEVLTKVNGGASWEQLPTPTTAVDIQVVPSNNTLNMDNSHHTAILNLASTSISLPTPASATGIIYVIVNRHATNSKLINRSFLLNTGTSTRTIPPQSSTMLQSNGISWYKIN